MNEFFSDLGARLAAAAARRGVEIEAPQLDAAVAEELLELARVTAHNHERRFAPLASYMAGAAAEKLRATGSAADAESVAALIREVRLQLETEEDVPRRPPA